MATDEQNVDTEDLTLDTEAGAPAGDVVEGVDGGEGLPPAEGTTPQNSAPEQWFPENWRDQMIGQLSEGEREKGERFLKNRQSPIDVLRASLSADSKISELTRDRVKIPGENADPKEVEQFRKALGIPESPDKYAFEVPEDVELTPMDEEFKGDFLSEAHKYNLNQKQIDFVKDTFYAYQRQAAAQMVANAKRAGDRSIDELRGEMGSDFRPNVELANRWLEQELSEAGMTDPNERREFLSKRFADGTALGEHPAFVRFAIRNARAAADDGAIVVGDSATTGSVDQRIDQIMSKMHSNPKEYEQLQPELQRLIAAQNRQKARR